MPTHTSNQAHIPNLPQHNNNQTHFPVLDTVLHKQ